MENRLKLGKVFTQKTQFADRQRINFSFHKVLICGLVLAFVSLSCAIGVLDQNDPLFNAPNGVGLWSPTPSINFPTDRPIITETIDPPILGVLPLSTDVPTPASVPVDTAPLLYYTQAGDTLPVVAIRFGVDASAITAPTGTFPATGLLTPNRSEEHT